MRTVFFYLYSILNLISYITSCTDCYKNYLIVYSASSNRKISFLQRISVRKERFKKREFFRTLNHFCKGRMRNIISTTLNDYIFYGNFFWNIHPGLYFMKDEDHKLEQIKIRRFLELPFVYLLAFTLLFIRKSNKEQENGLLESTLM